MFIDDLKRKIVDKCDKCNGTGYIGLEICDCMCLLIWYNELYKSNIPRLYWNQCYSELEYDNKIKLLIKEYLSNIKNVVFSSLGFFFYGDYAVGKTSLMIEIAKLFLIEKYDIFYITAKQFINNNYEEDKKKKKHIENKLFSSKLIIFDEIDKVYTSGRGSKYNVNLIDDFFRNTIPNQKVFLIGSNETLKSLEKKFSKSIYSFLLRYLKPLKIGGKRYDEELNKNWIKRLDTNFEIIKEEVKILARKYSKDWDYNSDLE